MRLLSALSSFGNLNIATGARLYGHNLKPRTEQIRFVRLEKNRVKCIGKQPCLYHTTPTDKKT